jgi:hypothetical protein
MMMMMIMQHYAHVMESGGIALLFLMSPLDGDKLLQYTLDRRLGGTQGR